MGSSQLMSNIQLTSSILNDKSLVNNGLTSVSSDSFCLVDSSNSCIMSIPIIDADRLDNYTIVMIARIYHM